MSDVRKWTAFSVLVLVVACTSAQAPASAGAPGAGTGETGVESGREALAGAALERAREALREARAAYEAVALEEAFDGAVRLVAEFPDTEIADSARWVAARSALALGRYEEARDHAAVVARVVEGEWAEDARAVVELAEDALQPPAADPVVLGVVLPRTGPRVLVRYADWVLEGIELAVAEAERLQRRPIELVVADDAGGARVRDAISMLERRGALAIVGPLLPEHLASAARARRGDGPLLVSPTATDPPDWAGTYSINADDGRGARDLGRYAVELGFEQAAVLYPRLSEFERKAEAFADAFEARGGEVRAYVPYDSGTTTFGPQMERILEAVAPRDTAGLLRPGGDTLLDPSWEPRPRLDPDSGGPWLGGPPQEPFALFAPASPRAVPQLAPQISFYGLDSAGVQVLGDAGWASSAVRRVVPDRDLEGVIAASHFPPGGGADLADSVFIRAYEARYRRTLDNRLPALGYDAANLVLQALPNRQLTTGALARRFRFLAGIRGATGVLSVREGRVVRIPYLVVIRAGELVPAPYPWEYERPVPKPPAPPER